ncbi:MAG: type II toxin-antitoxin system ParD family antitoxin [Zavarzinella sp.]|nr:type II toxin-antitoxin system ParD family antitoxin [Zavarzinella sp.]
MEITLPPELERFIREQVARGKYASPIDVVVAGLELLRNRRRTAPYSIEELRQEVQVGMAQAECGQVSPADPMALLEEVEREFTRREPG